MCRLQDGVKKIKNKSNLTNITNAKVGEFVHMLVVAETRLNS